MCTFEMACSVVIIIPVFRREDVFTTLRVLQTQAYAKSCRLIIVDNGNESVLSERLKGLASECCQIIRIERNVGGAGAYRAGMNAAMEMDADYVWLLDDDAEVNTWTLPGLVYEHERLTALGIRVGAVGSMIMGQENPNRVTDLGANISPVTGLIRQRFVGLTRKSLGERTDEVDYVAACSLLVSMKALREVGPFEQVFIHWDDIDWQFRLKELGYHNFATTKSYVNHLEAVVKRKDWIWYYDTRNPLWFLRRHMPWAIPVSLFLRLGRAVLFALTGRIKAAKIMLFGMWHAFTGQLLMRDELPL